MENIGPTAKPLTPITIIDHGPDPLVGIYVSVEVRRAFGESGKLGNDD